MSAFQNQVDELIAQLIKIKNVDVFQIEDNNKKLKKENKDLKEKIAFFSEKSMTIDDLYIRGKINYQEYKNQLDQLNDIRDRDEFKK